MRKTVGVKKVNGKEVVSVLKRTVKGVDERKTVRRKKGKEKSLLCMRKCV